MIDSRNTKDVQKVLNEYENLKFLSRDKGYQYKVLSSKYNHIADGFHLLQNFTESVSSYLKASIARNLYYNIDSIIMIQPPEVTENNNKLTKSQENKIKFIKEVYEIYKNNCSFRKTAEICNSNRSTVKKYVDMKNIKRESIYFREPSRNHIYHNDDHKLFLVDYPTIKANNNFLVEYINRYKKTRIIIQLD